MPGSIQSDSLDETWNNVDNVGGPGDTGDDVGGSGVRVKIEDDDEAMGVESAVKEGLKIDAMALDVDGGAGDGEPTPASQEEVVAQTLAPKEFDISSRADSDKTMVVPPPALPSGSAEAPTPPPGKNFPTPEAPPQWLGPTVFEATLSAFNTSFQHVAAPMIEQAVHRALKRHHDESHWHNGGSGGGGGGAWPNDYKKKNNMGGARNSPESSSRSSSWRAPKCQRCYGNFIEFETKDWKEAWDTSLESPTELKDGPQKWNTSMSAYLYTATCKAVKENLVKPNYDAATLSLVQNKLEKALYNPEQAWNEYRFLLVHKTSKYVTLACQFCRQMSTLEYATLEPLDGRKLHIFFNNHLGGGICDHGKRRYS